MTREEYELERLERLERELEWWNLEFLLSVESDPAKRAELRARMDSLLR